MDFDPLKPRRRWRLRLLCAAAALLGSSAQAMSVSQYGHNLATDADHAGHAVVHAGAQAGHGVVHAAKTVGKDVANGVSHGYHATRRALSGSSPRSKR